MKKCVQIITAFALLFVLVSCKNKNENNVTEIESIQNPVDISETEDEAVADNGIDEEFLSTPLPENKIKYIPFRYNGKYGLLGEQMDVRLEPSFDEVGVFDYAVTAATQYLEDYNGHDLYRYDYTLFDRNLNVLEEDTAASYVSEKYWGYDSPYTSYLINVIDGTRIDLPKEISFNGSNTEQEKYYSAKSYYLNKDLTKTTFGKKMSEVFPFREGKALVYGYDDVFEPYFTVINEDGEKLFDGIWDASMYYSEGLLPVFLDNGVTDDGIPIITSGVINESGEMIFKCSFYSDNSGGKIHPRIEYMFKDGVCVAKIYERDNVYLWKIIDKKGNFTKLPENIEPLKDYYPTFKEGYLALKSKDKENAKYIFINKNAEQVFGVTFDYADDFVNGYAVVVYKGEDAVLDTQGNVYLSKDLLNGNKKPFVNLLEVPSIFDDFWGSFSDTPTENGIKAFGNIEEKNTSDDKDSYAARSGYEAVVNVVGEYGSVEYWRKGGDLRFQLFSLEKHTDFHPLSVFIGKNYDSVLAAYPVDSSYVLSGNELIYNSSNNEFFITFELSDGIIDRIVLGRNL